MKNNVNNDWLDNLLISDLVLNTENTIYQIVLSQTHSSSSYQIIKQSESILIRLPNELRVQKHQCRFGVEVYVPGRKHLRRPLAPYFGLSPSLLPTKLIKHQIINNIEQNFLWQILF